MKRHFLPLSALLLCLAVFSLPAIAQSPATDRAPAPPQTITAAFWNIQWFPGRRPDATRKAEAKQIASVHQDITQLAAADLIGMEEVRDFENAAVAMQPLRGFKVDVCSNFPPREGQDVGQQVAIASRLAPMSAWAETWRDHGTLTPPRGFVFAAYQTAPRQLLLAYAVHLKSNRGSLRENMVVREESIRQLLAHMSSMQRAYEKLGRLAWIVGGDFNTAPDESRFKLEKSVTQLLAADFKWIWQGVPLESRMTLPPSRLYPAACFDHIFYRGASLQEARVINTSPLSSDHRAIAATFELTR